MSMPLDKRWYQLSMLQILVAMAVVAVFVTKNMEVKSAWNDTRSGYDNLIAGWPFMYWSEVYYIRAPEPISQGSYRVWWAIPVNAICCLSTCVLSVVFVKILSETARTWLSPN